MTVRVFTSSPQCVAGVHFSLGCPAQLLIVRHCLAFGLKPISDLLTLGVPVAKMTASELEIGMGGGVGLHLLSI